MEWRTRFRSATRRFANALLNAGEGLRRISRLYDEFFYSRFRREILAENRDSDDLFVYLTLSELAGLPGPLFYYTMELYPLMLEEYHRWHLRMGMDHSPLDRIRCC